MHPTLAVLKKAAFVPELKAGVTSQPFKRAQEGLFQGRSKQYGNNVPFSKHKTRRSWLPNVQNKRLYSEALNETIKLKVTARAVKTITKHGGLDNYLLKGSEPKDLSDEGMRLRVRILEAMRNTKKHYIPPIESPLERSRILASRATKRVRRMGVPTLQDAAKVRLSVMGKLGIMAPDPTANDPYRDYQLKTGQVLKHLYKKAAERRALVGHCSVQDLALQAEMAKKAAEVPVAVLEDVPEPEVHVNA